MCLCCGHAWEHRGWSTKLCEMKQSARQRDVALRVQESDGHIRSSTDVGFRVVDDARRKRFRADTSRGVSMSRTAVSTEVVDIEQGGVGIIDGDEFVILGSGERVLASEVQPHMRVFCPACETLVDMGRDRSISLCRRVAGVGVDSGVARLAPGGDVATQCFNSAVCGRQTIIRPVAEQWGFSAEEHEEIRIDDKINYNGRMDIDLEALLNDVRVVYLDGPMGCGKTHLVQSYIEGHEEAKVLVVTFRRSLARDIATRFGINCYLGGMEDEADSGMEHFFRSRELWSRCIVQLDSLYRLKGPADPKAYVMGLSEIEQPQP